jgi:hypothetical protein
VLLGWRVKEALKKRASRKPASSAADPRAARSVAR